MDILTRMKNTTRADIDALDRSDFDDLPRGHFSAAKLGAMIRIVEGATDLIQDRPRPASPGMITLATTEQLRDSVTGDDGLWENDHGDGCNNPGCCPSADPRSPGQIRFIDSLISDLTALDAELGAKATQYTQDMTAHGRWTRNNGMEKGTISIWIDRLKAKIAKLKADAPVATPTKRTGKDYDDAPFQSIQDGNYAVADAGPDDIHYFRISRFRDGGIKVQERASDELHPVRRGGRRTAILTTIMNDPRAAMELFGQTIGRCGRCYKSLTDSLSRSRGIGPDCWDKM